MSDTAEVPQIQAAEAPYRDVQFGRIYNHLETNQEINIAALGNIGIEIDEENLGLERVSMENLLKGWERDREGFEKNCRELELDMDPFEIYKYYQIQRKAFQVLGQPTQNATARNNRFSEMGNKVKLSQTKGNAMCSEYAILSAYIAQKIGEPVHLIVGSAVETDDTDSWRESHAYVWNARTNSIFDSVLAQSENEYPAIMQPTTPASLARLEAGHDIQAKRIGSNFTRSYGLEAGGFGVRLDREPALAK